MSDTELCFRVRFFYFVNLPLKYTVNGIVNCEFLGRLNVGYRRNHPRTAPVLEYSTSLAPKFDNYGRIFNYRPRYVVLKTLQTLSLAKRYCTSSNACCDCIGS